MEHMKQSLQTWFVWAETLTLQVQLSRGDTGSASQTLNDGLSLYRELNQKALQGLVKILVWTMSSCVFSAFNRCETVGKSF